MTENIVMKFRTQLLTACCLLALSRSAFAQSTKDLEPYGLAGKKVIALALARQASASGSFFYAATSDAGVWRHVPAQVDTAWESIGLIDKEISALDIHVWGSGPALFHAPIAGVAPRWENNDSTLVYRYENGQWLANDAGMARREIFQIRALMSFESGGHLPPAGTFAGGSGFVYRSNTSRRVWELGYFGGIGGTNTIAVNRTQLSGVVWAGGETTIFAPWIAKSLDEGKTWEVFYPDLSGDNACDALALDPNDANTVYAGMEGAVLKTTDAGRTWQKTGLRDTPVYFYGLALDANDANHIYAGGTIADPNTWALWESFDAGATWREIAAPNGTGAGQGIRSLVADPNQAGVIYIATAGYGVWKYQSAPTHVNDPPRNNLPQGFALAQNVPNPFSRNAAQATVMRYSIPATQQIKVEIYDLLGKHVATLVDRVQAPGEYTAQWNGKDAAGRLVPSGIYFYRLVAGMKTLAARKMILMQ